MNASQLLLRFGDSFGEPVKLSFSGLPIIPADLSLSGSSAGLSSKLANQSECHCSHIGRDCPHLRPDCDHCAPLRERMEMLSTRTDN